MIFIRKLLKIKIRNIFQAFLIWATGNPRYLPEIKWSYFWTHNIFRFYELIFGRKFGIKAEMTATAVFDGNGNPKSIIYRPRSFEAVCALLEQYIRGFFKGFKVVRLYIPRLQTAGALFQPSPFLFAIAFDAQDKKVQAAGTTTATLSFTCTGSDLFLGAEFGWESGLTASGTYNSVSMTKVGTDQSTQGGVSLENTLYLVGPATGANNLVLTASGTAGAKTINASSYSGVSQTGQPSATSEQATANISSPLSGSVTTVDDNSWIVWGFGITAAASAGTNCTLRNQELDARGAGIADTNSAQTPAGSKTMTLTFAGTNLSNGFMMAISPAGAAAATTNYLSLLGVGS